MFFPTPQARLALTPSDEGLEAFVAEAEDIVWQQCNFIDESSDVGAHEMILRKVRVVLPGYNGPKFSRRTTT